MAKETDENVISLDISKIVDGLKTCAKIATSQTANLEFKGRDCYISTQATFFKVKTKIADCLTSDLNKNICIDTTVFNKVLGSFKRIDLELTDEKINFKSGKVKGNLALLKYNEIKVIPDNTNLLFSFDELREDLLNVLPRLELTATEGLPENESELSVLIKSTGKEIKFLCTDRMHGIFATLHKETPEFELELPVKYISLMDLFDKKFELSSDSNCLYMYNDDTQICLSQVSCVSIQTIDNFEKFITSKTADVDIVDFNVSKFREGFNTGASVKTNTNDILMKIKESRMFITCDSELGSVKTKIKVDVPAEYNLKKAVLHYSSLPDNLKLLDSETCKFSIYDNLLGFTYDKDNTTFFSYSLLGR